MLTPQVIYTDKYAQNIRFMFEAVPLPSGFQITYGIAADTSIYDIEIQLGVLCEKMISYKMHETEAKGLIGRQISVGIGYAVTNEEDGLIVAQFDFLVHCHFLVIKLQIAVLK